ncbi:MAG: 16S rRNA (cytosine(967)-C(5))-methyltransferase RsmB, partial [Burkholderiales bacterium]|nr:16S rRNA (cytosine(967)-C(5))-methyltransferase RsmB [Burkholderiales bacterium]
MQKRPLISLKAAQSAPRPPKKGGKPVPQGGTKAPLAAKTHTPLPQAAARPMAQRAEDPRTERADARAELLASFKPDLPQESLAYSLLGAANAISLVQGGTALPEALTKSFALTGASTQARGAMQDIAYRSMRQLGRCQLLIGILTTKQPAPALLYGLLCAALALLQKDEDGLMPYEEFTVVDQAVTLAGIHPGIAHGKGMMNAVLRRFLRERDALLAQVMQEEVAQLNYPQWWIDNCKAAYPRNWRTILLAGNQNPPLTLRVNQRLSSV